MKKIKTAQIVRLAAFLLEHYSSFPALLQSVLIHKGRRMLKLREPNRVIFYASSYPAFVKGSSYFTIGKVLMFDFIITSKFCNHQPYPGHN